MRSESEIGSEEATRAAQEMDAQVEAFITIYGNRTVDDVKDRLKKMAVTVCQIGFAQGHHRGDREAKGGAGKSPLAEQPAAPRPVATPTPGKGAKS